MEITELTRDEYLISVQKLSHFKSLKFAKIALDWWDNYYSWTKFPPICLTDNKTDFSYLFYSISKDNRYLTIHNLLTPFPYQRKGYGNEMLKTVFKRAMNQKVERFKMICVASSLKFYNQIGLNYWGVNENGLYYCDYKMPKNSIKEIPSIVDKATVQELSNIDLETIYDKVKLNGEDFDEKETEVFKKSLKLLGGKYKFADLKKEANERFTLK